MRVRISLILFLFMHIYACEDKRDEEGGKIERMNRAQ